jgi:hypothetical protein
MSLGRLRTRCGTGRLPLLTAVVPVQVFVPGSVQVEHQKRRRGRKNPVADCRQTFGALPGDPVIRRVNSIAPWNRSSVASLRFSQILGGLY